MELDGDQAESPWTANGDGHSGSTGNEDQQQKAENHPRGELLPVSVRMVGEDRKLLDGKLLVDFRECSQAIANRAALDSHVDENKANIAVEGVVPA